MITETDRERAELRRLQRARAGDGAAFDQLIEPYRRELEVHCYRMLGSLIDAEDALQETLLSAWQSLGSFEHRASLRTWLYRIATNRCLNALRTRSRRPRPAGGEARAGPGGILEPTRLGEPIELGPYPDELLASLPDDAPGPEARFEQREAVELAFMVALQSLPPRQRAALVLRDVLGFRAAEAAELMDTGIAAANSALQRARATIERSGLAHVERDRSLSEGDRELLESFAAAFESGDVDRIVALMSEDAVVAMPPEPWIFQGRSDIAEFLATFPFRDRGDRYPGIWTRANGRPALATYRRAAGASAAHEHGMMVLAIEGGEIRQLTAFRRPGSFAHFRLPAVVAD